MRIRFGIRQEAPIVLKRSEGVICENLALVSPIAVIAASAAIENSRCKFFAQRATGS